MSKRSIFFLVLLLPLFTLAQGPVTASPAGAPLNAQTLAVLLANRPDRFSEEQWLRMMQEPVNRTLYPLRVNQAMLDTLDATQLDRGFQYVMVKEDDRAPVSHER